MVAGFVWLAVYPALCLYRPVMVAGFVWLAVYPALCLCRPVMVAGRVCMGSRYIQHCVYIGLSWSPGMYCWPVYPALCLC